MTGAPGTVGGRHATPVPPSRVGRVLRVVLAAVVLLLVLSVLGVLPVQPMRVSSASMSPTLGPGDLVLVARWPLSVDRFDVVVAEPEDPAADPLVKRVVALAGESVEIADGVLVVDGAAVCEPWSDPARLDGVWFGPVVVPAGHVFLLGDERDGSVDSRAFGAVSEERVVGEIVAGVWPIRGTVPTAAC